MTLETRTRWIPISELSLEHDIAGFGPVESFYRRDGIVGVSNIFGAYREYNAGTQIELYEGTFDETGRRVSMSTADYKASVRAERARR